MKHGSSGEHQLSSGHAAAAMTHAGGLVLIDVEQQEERLVMGQAAGATGGLRRGSGQPAAGAPDRRAGANRRARRPPCSPTAVPPPAPPSTTPQHGWKLSCREPRLLPPSARFPSLAAYEQYRTLFGADPEFIAADQIRDESGCVLRYQRTFMRPLLPAEVPQR
jgi:hypothetical protein